MTIDSNRHCMFVLTIVVLAALSVSGCGLKGDLYLPDAQPEPQSSPLPSVEQSGNAPNDQGDDESPDTVPQD